MSLIKVCSKCVLRKNSPVENLWEMATADEFSSLLHFSFFSCSSWSLSLFWPSFSHSFFLFYTHFFFFFLFPLYYISYYCIIIIIIFSLSFSILPTSYGVGVGVGHYSYYIVQSGCINQSLLRSN